MTAAEAMRRIGEPPGSSLAVSTTGLTKRSGEHSVADGGEGMSCVHGLIVAAVYLIAAMTATAVTFSRRDVTA